MCYDLEGEEEGERMTHTYTEWSGGGGGGGGVAQVYREEGGGGEGVIDMICTLGGREEAGCTHAHPHAHLHTP